MKKLLSLLLAVLMLCSLGACGKTEQTSGSTSSLGSTSTKDDRQSTTATFPDHYIEIVNCWSAGGFNDMSARIIASVGSNYLSEPMVVVSKTGGSGAVGAQYACEDGPTAYRLIWGMSTQAIFGPLTTPDYPFSFDDWDYVCSLCATERVLVVKAGTYDSFEELLDYSKANPGKVLYGSSGVGAIGHLSAEMVAKETDVEWTHVPYDGSAAALAALVGGHINMVSAQPSEMMELFEAGEVVPLLATVEMEQFPGVPTLESLGYGKWNARTIYPLGVPAGTPKEDMKVLEDVFKQVSEDASFLKMMDNIGAEVVFMTGEETKEAYTAMYNDMKAICDELDLK